MRLKTNRLGLYYHREAIVKKDNEGNSYLEYGEAHSFKAETWAAGGKLQSEMYGIRLSNIRNLRLDGAYREVHGPGKKVSFQVTQGETTFSIATTDGICLYSDDEPDYKVVAIYPYSHLTLEVDKL